MAQAVQAHQRDRCEIYRRFGYEYLPVAAFKQTAVTSFPEEEAEHVFESSGTGRGLTSRHFVRSLDIYERAVSAHFEAVFGTGPLTLVAHLPRYADRGRRSSLVYMVDYLIRRYGDESSGFFLTDHAVLEKAIGHSQRAGRPLLLLGAAFGLLDLVERHTWTLPPGARVIETGGMKTQRQEITRAELHRRLAHGLGISEDQVWSEYGMCELMSQAYAHGGSVYFPPPWMSFRICDPLRPERIMPDGHPGALALLDLANMHSVSSILTEDLGVRRGEGFEVLGRLPQSELRGCNFLLDGL